MRRSRRNVAAVALFAACFALVLLLQSGRVSPVPQQQPPYDSPFSSSAASVVVIIGAGPAGLGAAWRMCELEQTPSFSLFEQAAVPGGLAASFAHGGFVYDFGGHVLFSRFHSFDRAVSALYERECSDERSCMHARTAFAAIPLELRGNDSSAAFAFVRFPVQRHIGTLAAIDPKLIEDIASELFSSCRGGGAAVPSNFREWLLASYEKTLGELFMLPYNAKVWSCPLEEMSTSWVGERVAAMDIRKLLRDAFAAMARGEKIGENKDEDEWGSNSQFFYPPFGGIGDIWTRMANTIDRVAPNSIRFGTRAVSVDLKRHIVTFERERQLFNVSYHFLVSTLPLQTFAELVVDPGLPPKLASALEGAKTSLKFTTVHVVGVGVCGCNEPPIARRTSWAYFPQPRDKVRFFRLTVLSHYSAHVAPRGCYSLMTETAESADFPLSPKERDNLPRDVVTQLKQLGFVGSMCSVMPPFVVNRTYAYPTPTLGRDDVVSGLHQQLESLGVFSRGRFGGYKYEVGNMDHSFMQGVEVGNRLVAMLRKVPRPPREIVLFHPAFANSQHWNRSFPTSPLPCVRNMAAAARSVATSLFVARPSVSKRHVVIAHFNESLSWTRELPADWASISIYTHSQDRLNVSSEVHYVSPNHGREAHLYLQFIVDNYHALPERILFLHAHESAWHAPSSLRLVQCVDWNTTHEFLAASTFYNDRKSLETWDLAAELRRSWADIFQPIFGEPFPTRLSFWCCAQFLVSRDRILARPKEIWQRLLEYVEDTSRDSEGVGYALEFLWHALLGQPFADDSSPKSPVLC